MKVRVTGVLIKSFNRDSFKNIVNGGILVVITLKSVAIETAAAKIEAARSAVAKIEAREIAAAKSFAAKKVITEIAAAEIATAKSAAISAAKNIPISAAFKVELS